SVAHQEEHSFLITQSRYKIQLMEIDYALSRIENGTYGICEETFEPIEDVRLKAIPWTRYSIEGAEIRESTTRKSERRTAY
ncbi:MAG: TraR/DksA family transcriptional regulator, partial [Bdellovibrionaceae bacterium]|nr:TraR/DksA family transcriptional regulator [Pseudobdellovibrionaceae bacterium]